MGPGCTQTAELVTEAVYCQKNLKCDMAGVGFKENRLEIEKLEGNDDWWEWKYSMALQLRAMKLWSHVDGTATLGPDASQADREKFDHTAVRAHSIIVRGLSKQVTSLVLRWDGAKAVWDRLVDDFEVKSVQNTIILRTEINQMKTEGRWFSQRTSTQREGTP